jgi:hypothetical protein
MQVVLPSVEGEKARNYIHGLSISQGQVEVLKQNEYQKTLFSKYFMQVVVMDFCQ